MVTSGRVVIVIVVIVVTVVLDVVGVGQSPGGLGPAFGVAVLSVIQEAYCPAAIQGIVYAGAIVILFLFVIMFLGVDRIEATERDPLPAQRVVGVVAGLGILVLSIVILLAGGGEPTGQRSATAPLSDQAPDIDRLGKVLFTDYVFAFEVTAVLLTVAVVGSVVLSRRPKGDPIDLDEFPDGPAVAHLSLFVDPDDEGTDDAADAESADAVAESADAESADAESDVEVTS